MGCSSETHDSNSIGFIDSMKLFENFKMKVEYDKILKDDLIRETLILDSITTLLKNSTDKFVIDKLNNEYQITEQLMNNKYDQYSMKYTKIVTTKLDEYINKFSKMKNLDIVFSGNNGTVLFVKDSKDLTDEMIKYANNLYEK